MPSLVEALEQRSLLSAVLFPADNPWNQRITAAPVAANSAAIINNIISRQAADGRLHPDFGQDDRSSADLYGIPYNIVHGATQPKVSVVIDAYPGESDLLNAPIPLNAVLEGDFQNGPKLGVNNRGDSHLIVWDQDNDLLYEFYRASRPSENADGKWHADQETVWDLTTNTFRTLGWTSADAAGLAILPGLVRPDEGLPVSQGGQGVINHAIRFTLQNAIILNQFLYPASHTANPGNTNPAIQPPMGSRFRLKAGVDISNLSPQSKIIAQAMKDYGLMLADNGSNFFFTGASYSVDTNNQFSRTWSDNDIQSTTLGLKSLHFSDFEVVDLTPIVTSLSSSTGTAGTSVTIVGQNFSGAAGRLQVLFGSTPANSITIVDDGHVTAVVPAGSGAVDVRVQSGVTTPSDPRNIKNPIFGYGISAITTGARFTYGTAQTTVAFVTASSSNSEAITTANLAVTLSAASSNPVTVTYAVTGGTASSTDFSLANGTLTFAAGETTKNIPVVIVNDVLTEVSETIQVTLSSPTNAQLGANAAHTYTILDDDPAGVLKFSAPTYSVSESGGSVSITVSRTSGSAGSVSVSYATSNGTAAAGSDYTATTGIVSWASGEIASKTFSVPILEDTLVEGSQTVNLLLSNATGGATLGSPQTATLTILDNDSAAGAFRFSTTAYSVNEGVRTATITVQRIGGSTGQVSVTYRTSNGTATAGSDYFATSGTLTFKSGQISKTFTVRLKNDTLVEGNETISLSLSNPAGGAVLGAGSQATLTIIDNEVAAAKKVKRRRV